MNFVFFMENASEKWENSLHCVKSINFPESNCRSALIKDQDEDKAAF